MFRKKKKTIKCPDGTKKIVYRNIEDAFPLFIPGYEKEKTAKAAGLDQLEGEVSLKAKTKIEGMFIDLNHFNSNIMLEFRVIYTFFESDPCKNSEHFRIKMDELITKYQSMNSLKLKLFSLIELAKTIESNKDDFYRMYIDIVNSHSEVLVTEAPKARIYQAQKSMKNLTQGKNEG